MAWVASCSILSSLKLVRHCGLRALGSVMLPFNSIVQEDLGNKDDQQGDFSQEQYEGPWFGKTGIKLSQEFNICARQNVLCTLKRGWKPVTILGPSHVKTQGRKNTSYNGVISNSPIGSFNTYYTPRHPDGPM